MNTIILLLRLLFTATLEDCLACSWPYESELNMNGECVPGYKYQDGLEVSCYAFCNTWQNRADTQQSVAPIWTFINADPFASTSPVCKCVRVNKGAYVTYIDRPQNVCRYGASDITQAYRDTSTQRVQQEVANQIRSFTFTPGNRYDTIKQIMQQMEGWRYVTANNYEQGIAYSYSQNCTNGEIQTLIGIAHSGKGPITGTLTGVGSIYGTVTLGEQTGTIDAPLNFNYGQSIQLEDVQTVDNNTIVGHSPLPPGITCAEIESKGVSTQLQALTEYQAGQSRRLDTAMGEIMNSMEAVAKQIQSNGEAQIQQMNTNDSMLLYRINSTAGGGGDVDFTPVVDAVQSLRNYIANKDSSDNASIGGLLTEIQDTIDNALNDNPASIDTQGIINGIRQTHFNPLTSQWSTDSAGLRLAVDNQTTCTQFPDDPEIELEYFNHEKIVIQISAYHDKLNMVRTMLKWAAIVTAALIYIAMISSMFSLNTSNK